MKFSIKSSIIGTMLVMLILIAANVFAGDGGLSQGTIEQLKKSFVLDAPTEATFNAITNNNINELALNRKLLNSHNEIFNHKIKTNGITNQKSSGRCWLFAGLNIMRPQVMEKYKLTSFEFSQNYLAFWDKMEKANCFLEHIIEYRDRDPLDREMEILLRDPFGDGGWWEYVVALIQKYGAMPKEIMPETNSSENTDAMNNLISRKLRMDAIELRKMHQEGKPIEQIRTEKEVMLSEIYRMLALNLGAPPSEFQWRFEDRDSVVSDLKTYTPKNFYEEYVGVDLNSYVSLFNDSSKDLDKHFTIKMSRNIYDGNDIDFVNTDIESLKKIAMKSVLEDEPVWFACDVGEDQYRDKGIMAIDIYDYKPVYGTELYIPKADRVLFRDSAPNHAMVFIGVDIQHDKPVKWLVENSWGNEKGSDGYWTLYDSWFDNHLYNIIVKKKFVPKEILKIFDEKAIELPPWDPMYSILK